MALGIGHINKLFEPGHTPPDLRKVAEQLRAEAAENPTAAAFLEALEADFPEVKEDLAAPETVQRKAA